MGQPIAGRWCQQFCPCDRERFGVREPIVIVDQAVDWLENRPTDRPWFLTVALVNPHDIMWFPVDHPSYQEANPEDKKAFESLFTCETATHCRRP